MDAALVGSPQSSPVSNTEPSKDSWYPTWQDGWSWRFRSKVGTAALATFLFSRWHALRKGKDLRRYVTLNVIGYSTAAATFSAVQETLRAVRGHHDAANTFAAGLLSGGAFAGYFQGWNSVAAGSLLWGCLALTAHLANNAFQPKYLLENYLVEMGLLSEAVQARRGIRYYLSEEEIQMAQSTEEVWDASTLDEGKLLSNSRDIMLRELHELNARLQQEAAARRAKQQQQQGASASSIASSSLPQQPASVPTPPARTWLSWLAFWRRKQASNSSSTQHSDTELDDEEWFDEEEFKRFLEISDQTAEKAYARYEGRQSKAVPSGARVTVSPAS